MFIGCLENAPPQNQQTKADRLDKATQLCGIEFHFSVFTANPSSPILALKSANIPISEDRETGCIAIGWVRIDNRELLKEAIDWPSRLVNSSFNDDICLILAAYLRWGDKLCQHLIGDFAFYIWDPRTQTSLLCRDQMGIRPLYYFLDQKTLIFSTSSSNSSIR